MAPQIHSGSTDWRPRIDRRLSLGVRIVGIVLVITALAKIASATGTSGFLDQSDPLLRVRFRLLFWAVGTVELSCGCACIFGRNILIHSYIIAILGVDLLAYRIGLWWIGYHRPCSCLGGLTDAIHLPPEAADNIMKVVLAFMLVVAGGNIVFRHRLSSR